MLAPTGVGSNYIPWSVKNGSGIQLAACDQYGWVDGVCHPKPTTWIRLPLNQFRMMGAGKSKSTKPNAFGTAAHTRHVP